MRQCTYNYVQCKIKAYSSLNKHDLNLKEHRSGLSTNEDSPAGLNVTAGLSICSSVEQWTRPL